MHNVSGAASAEQGAMGTPRRVSQLRPLGVREGSLEEVAFDLGLEGEWVLKRGTRQRRKMFLVENTAHAKAWISLIRPTQ